jgi:hypothetical protein
MPGIRLGHTEARSGLYLVEHPTRKYRVPLTCSTCGSVHIRKTYHLHLDAEGCVIVSPVVFERLRECGLPSLEILNEVENPPPMTLQIDVPLSFQKSVEDSRVETRFNRIRAMYRRRTQPRWPSG